MDRTADACPRPTVVVGAQGEEIANCIGARCDYVFQSEPLGTAHAVSCAKEALAARKDITSILVLYGDHPLVTAKTAMELASTREKNGATIAMATVHIPNFDGDLAIFRHWGRIARTDTGELIK